MKWLTQSNISWLDSIAKLKGVGPKTQERFEYLGVYTIRDLMWHFPFRFEDMRSRDIETLLDGEKVTLKGKIVSEPVVNFYSGRKNRLVFRLAVGEEHVITVSFFNQHYLVKQIQIGQTIGIYGKWDAGRNNLLGMKILSRGVNESGFNPVYPATQGLSQKQIQTVIRQAFTDYYQCIPEIIPVRLNDAYHLIPLNQALLAMHFPKSASDHQQGQRKIIYTEFFLYQWRIQGAQVKNRATPGIEIHYDSQALKQAIQVIPFELTQAQKKAVNEACFDLLAPYAMRRLLQGDVGSGKTLVAFISMLAAVYGGFQTALLVPTEILARQHFVNFNQLFQALNIRAELLISDLKTQEKKQIMTGLANERIRVVIGTHALIQDSVEFKRLGLVVIDEQHRFGVHQRQQLLTKGEGVNLLQMTATPIPRSLAQTIYGDMSVSTLTELPKGRQKIITRVVAEGQLEQIYQQIEDEVQKGRQVYYVLPIIESSNYLQEVENVQAAYQRLNQRFPHLKLGALHGQLDKVQQEGEMRRFKSGEINILVATTMIEVGVDVPNASIMVIQSAERFGLAQLHQLRGRVGRGAYQSYCFLIADPKTDQGRNRLAIMEQSQDGFKIAQKDMQIRGIGDVLGEAQSGLPRFAYANLIEDEKVLQVAKMDVSEIYRHPEMISEEELAILKQDLQTFTIQS